MVARVLMPYLRWRPLPTLPVSGNFMTGVSATTTRGQTTAQSLATTEAASGHQAVKRVYANDTYVTFNLSNLISGDYDSTNKVALRTTHLSWNPDMIALQNENTPNSGTQFSGFDPTLGFNAWKAGGYQGTVTGYGTETTKNITALRTIPDYHNVILTPCHEADEYQAQRTYGSNYGAFRNGFRIIADIIHAFGNPNWRVCLLLTAYGFKGSSDSTRYPSNFWPAWSGLPSTGNNYVDVMGVDIYNEGSLSGTNWDSPGACMGIPYDSAERTQYQARYGGTNGWRTSDPSTSQTWTNGFLGWMEMQGITQWIIGELGSARNIMNLTPSWVSTQGISNSKNAWITAFGNYLASYNADPTHNAKCIGVEYFMSAGRTYSGPNYLTQTIHDSSTGLLISGIVGKVADTSTLPATGNTGDKYFVASATQGDIYTWNGSAWVDSGVNGLQESWQLWWNDDGSGWDSSTISGYPFWGINTTSYSSAGNGYGTGGNGTQGYGE